MLFGMGCLCTIGVACAQPVLSDLIVEAGTQRTIPARLDQAVSVHIKEGGTLVQQPGSSRWTILRALGSVKVGGRIVGASCGNPTGVVRDRTPDGAAVEHQYARGGRGGQGGYSNVASAGAKNGGPAADGTADYGGGGGSPGGINIMGRATRLGSSGKDAAGQRGAAPAADGGVGRWAGTVAEAVPMAAF